MVRASNQILIQSELPEDMQHFELGGMLGPHIVPFLPILFAIILPFITCILTYTIISSDHSKVYNVLSHYFMLNPFCITLYITFEPNH